jgi:hypothetical protein
MKRSRLPVVNAVIGLLLPPVLFLGCSLVGLVIGPAADAELDDLRPTFRQLPPGTPISVILGENVEVSGRYMGVKDKSPEMYLREYESALRSLKTDTPVPLPGDSLRVRRAAAPEVTIRGRFLGVDPGVLLLSLHPRGNPARLPIETLLDLTTDEGGEIDLPTLRDCMKGELLPYRMETILIKGETDTTRIPFSSVVKITEGVAGMGKWTFFTVGLVIDIAVVGVMIAKANKEQ